MQIQPLTRIIERTVGLPSVQPTASAVADCPGHIKVRLTYLTDEPKHYRSYQLAIMYGLRGPFTEEACVFVPAKSVKSLDLPAWRHAFGFLQKNYVISKTARLTKVTLLDEDATTLAYVCN